MKKYFYLVAILLASLNGKAQNVPNGDFENWTNYGIYSYPNLWRTTDSVASVYGQHSVLQDSTPSEVWSGRYSMKMLAWQYSIFKFPGAATNGTLNTNTYAFEGGTPDTVRHTTLTGWYLYSPISDTCSVTVSLTKWNGTSRDMVGGGTWSTGNTVSSYALFTMPITYSLTENPDTVLIVIETGAISASHAGTTLIIDDLIFSGVSGINEVSSNLVSVNAFPNPASDFLTIDTKWKTPIKATVSILDISGKLLATVAITNNKQQVDISSLSSGNYFYELVDERGTKLYTGKFSVNH